MSCSAEKGGKECSVCRAIFVGGRGARMKGGLAWLSVSTDSLLVSGRQILPLGGGASTRVQAGLARS